MADKMISAIEAGRKMREYRIHVWNEANAYLVQRIGMALIREYMAAPPKPETVAQVYQALLNSATNRQGMQNSIGNLKRLSGVLCDFDPRAVRDTYPDGWRDLFDAVKGHVHPTSRMEKNNTHNLWVIFCKSCVSAAKYVARLDTLCDFIQYVEDFDATPDTRVALPFLMGYEIFGVKFALACDFLKEIGFSNYSKPDTHLTDIFSGLRLCGDSPLEVFRSVTEMAIDVKETPYAVDKVLWLIGSGNLYKHERSFSTDKTQFVRMTKAGWKVP